MLSRSVGSAVTVTLGFGLFGLLDDLAGSGDRRGFRGHLGALTHGELTTGMVKLVGGGLVAIVATVAWAGGSLPHLLAAALVVALAANLGNLLDRAPGRVGKVALVGFVALAVSSRMAPALTGPALVAGAGAGMLVPDLRERCMLGDTGANVLGAGVGLGLVTTTGPGAWWVAVAGAGRAQPPERAGQLQPGDRPHRPAALAGPPRRPTPLRVSAAATGHQMHRAVRRRPWRAPGDNSVHDVPSEAIRGGRGRAR